MAANGTLGCRAALILVTSPGGSGWCRVAGLRAIGVVVRNQARYSAPPETAELGWRVPRDDRTRVIPQPPERDHDMLRADTGSASL
jgi:hypothetical protein